MIRSDISVLLFLQSNVLQCATILSDHQPPLFELKSGTCGSEFLLLLLRHLGTAPETAEQFATVRKHVCKPSSYVQQPAIVLRDCKRKGFIHSACCRDVQLYLSM